MQQTRKNRQPGRIPRRAFPVARYLGVLMVALNLLWLPAETWLAPGFTGSRRFLMVWATLLLALDELAVHKVRRLSREDSLSFLALAAPGLFLVDAAAMAHLYLCWLNSGKPPVRFSPAAAFLLLPMAAGCVLWIYGQALPVIPFGSVWGIRVQSTLTSEEDWRRVHLRVAGWMKAAGAACLVLGTLLL